MKYKNFLHSGYTFSDKDYEKSSRYVLINTILSVGNLLVFGLAVLLFLKGEVFYAVSNFIYIILGLYFIYLLRKFDHAYHAVVPFLILSSLSLLTIALVEYPNENVRVAWFLLIITVSYFLGGIKYGNIATAISMLDIFIVRQLINEGTDTYITVLALVIIFMGSMFVNLYERRNTKAKQILLDLNEELENKVVKRTQELSIQKDALEHHAYHDTLTELPNRVFFNKNLQAAIDDAMRGPSTFALFFIDLDNFKHINDSLGHDIGDDVLKAVTKRLKSKIRGKDVLSRIGGDEFTIIMCEISGEKDAARLGQDLLNTLIDPISVKEHIFYVTASIGICIYPQDASDTHTLLKYSDVAMYKAKSLGRNNFQFYSPEMTESAYEKMLMASSLRQAIINNDFVVHYQPQIDPLTESILGVEALVRWNHETMGMITPGTFIELAQEKNLLVEIDTLVMDTAMKQVGDWYRAGLNVGTLSLNISMHWLERNNFFELIQNNIEKYGFDPAWLSLEITESQIMENPTDSIMKLQKLSELGIELAIDDFGTGYSSLSYLNRLPVNKVKIDKSFIQDIPSKEEDITIVKAIIALAGNLNLKVIAEGVETLEQKNFLVSHGCENIQGFYYGKPMPHEELFTRFLSQQVVA